MSDHEMRSDTSGKPRLVGVFEIRLILGLSRQRIHQLADRPDFPKPFQELAMGRVWLEEDIENWSLGQQPGR
ncbi:helix-turn-helix transcriptional regulator [Actinoplanes awajinensis]|nr:AlpA family phage regulatory protein [Actinoplanes awajinensis]